MKLKTNFFYLFAILYLCFFTNINCISLNYNKLLLNNFENEKFSYKYIDSIKIGNTYFFRGVIKNKIIQSDSIDGYWNYDNGSLYFISYYAFLNKCMFPICFFTFNKSYSIKKVLCKHKIKILYPNNKIKVEFVKLNDFTFQIIHFSSQFNVIDVPLGNYRKYTISLFKGLVNYESNIKTVYHEIPY